MTPLISAIPLVLWQFAVSDQGFVPTGDVGQWSWAVPTSGPGGVDAVWSTNPGGQYFNDTTEQLTVALPDLSGALLPTLSFRHWYNIWSGDAGWIEVHNGTSWSRVAPVFDYPNVAGFVGDSGGWVTSTVDLSGLGAGSQLRFVFQSDVSISAPGWYVSEVSVYDGDVTAPLVVGSILPIDNEDVFVDQAVQVQVVEDQMLVDVGLRYALNGAGNQVVAMSFLGGELWEGLIPGQPANTVIEWSVEASDGEQTTLFPSLVTSFRVFLPAPTGVVQQTSSRTVATSVDLSWTAPVSVHDVRGYQVEDAESGHLMVASTSTHATVPLLPGLVQAVVVRAQYDDGIGDASGALDVDVEVPDLIEVAPSAAYQGDRVRVRLEGQSLYLLQQSSDVDFGPDIVVERVDVLDIDVALVDLIVGERAAVGARELSIEGTQGRFQFSDSFTVLDGADAPGIRSVSPEVVRQGDTVSLVVTASEPFDGPIEVSGSEAFVFTDAVVVDGPKATIEMVVSGNAQLGVHTVVLDDGVRMWIADVMVDERVYTGETGCVGCASASNRPGFIFWLVLPLVIRRRS